MRTPHRLIFFLMLTAVFVTPYAGTSAQTSEDDCTTLRAQLSGDSQLELVDPQTFQIVRTEQLLYPFDFEHSPDCRFLIGHSTGYGDCTPGLIIWDATSGERMQTFDRWFCDIAGTTFPHLIWRPDNTAAIISDWLRVWSVTYSSRNRYLWYPDGNQLVPLEAEDYWAWDTVRPTLTQVEWDDARSWVWSSGIGGVSAFDVHSGARVREFSNPSWLAPDRWVTMSSFLLSVDRTHMVVYGHWDFTLRIKPAITVYDIATGIGVQVNPELNGAGTVALSPDNRYLTTSYTAIRVWDLQNLPENVEDRLPVYRLPLPQSLESRVYFTDNTTLVAETESGDLRYVYDMITGQRIE